MKTTILNSEDKLHIVNENLTKPLAIATLVPGSMLLWAFADLHVIATIAGIAVSAGMSLSLYERSDFTLDATLGSVRCRRQHVRKEHDFTISIRNLRAVVVEQTSSSFYAAYRVALETESGSRIPLTTRFVNTSAHDDESNPHKQADLIQQWLRRHGLRVKLKEAASAA